MDLFLYYYETFVCRSVSDQPNRGNIIWKLKQRPSLISWGVFLKPDVAKTQRACKYLIRTFNYQMFMFVPLSGVAPSGVIPLTGRSIV